MSFRPDPFRCEVRETPTSAVVELHGELDLSTVDEAREALHVATASKRAVTADLRGLSFIDSTGLRLILDIDGAARRDGFTFEVVRGSEPVQRVFAITGLEEHLVFVDGPGR